MTDRLGRVALGTLIEIAKVVAHYSGISETWMINCQEQDSWTLAKHANLVEGEVFEMPVNFDDSKPLQHYEASLGLYRYGNIISDMFKRIELEKRSHYHMLKLQGLEVGEYRLTLKMCANEFENIKITVHKGKRWLDP